MYYSGVLYAHGRDPVPIFEAIAMLNNDGLVNGQETPSIGKTLYHNATQDGSELTKQLTFQDSNTFEKGTYFTFPQNSE